MTGALVAAVKTSSGGHIIIELTKKAKPHDLSLPKITSYTTRTGTFFPAVTFSAIEPPPLMPAPTTIRS